ncbi:hypothetical protein ACT80S_06785 [Ramlibacter sp. MAHUQ-53]|uniref:hypothetical protein n=1 Tax=unclassified Ramlibacter TaxID=2617605 RepID=UPI003629052C
MKPIHKTDAAPVFRPPAPAPEGKADGPGASGPAGSRSVAVLDPAAPQSAAAHAARQRLQDAGEPEPEAGCGDRKYGPGAMASRVTGLEGGAGDAGGFDGELLGRRWAAGGEDGARAERQIDRWVARLADRCQAADGKADGKAGPEPGSAGRPLRDAIAAVGRGLACAPPATRERLCQALVSKAMAPGAWLEGTDWRQAAGDAVLLGTLGALHASAGADAIAKDELLRLECEVLKARGDLAAGDRRRDPRFPLHKVIAELRNWRDGLDVGQLSYLRAYRLVRYLARLGNAGTLEGSRQLAAAMQEVSSGRLIAIFNQYGEPAWAGSDVLKVMMQGCGVNAGAAGCAAWAVGCDLDDLASLERMDASPAEAETDGPDFGTARGARIVARLRELQPSLPGWGERHLVKGLYHLRTLLRGQPSRVDADLRAMLWQYAATGEARDVVALATQYARFAAGPGLTGPGCEDLADEFVEISLRPRGVPAAGTRATGERRALILEGLQAGSGHPGSGYH